MHTLLRFYGPGGPWANARIGATLSVDTSIVEYEMKFGRILDLTREEWNSGGPNVAP